jgi:hypothetical protein
MCWYHLGIIPASEVAKFRGNDHITRLRPGDTGMHRKRRVTLLRVVLSVLGSIFPCLRIGSMVLSLRKKLNGPFPCQRRKSTSISNQCLCQMLINGFSKISSKKTLKQNRAFITLQYTCYEGDLSPRP